MTDNIMPGGMVPGDYSNAPTDKSDLPSVAADLWRGGRTASDLLSDAWAPDFVRLTALVQERVHASLRTAVLVYSTSDEERDYWERHYVVMSTCGQSMTHVAMLNSEGGAQLNWGHYDMLQDEALNDALTRAANHSPKLGTYTEKEQ